MKKLRRWQPLHSMTTERLCHHGLSLEIAWLLLVESIQRSEGSRTIEVWNGTTDTWTQLPARFQQSKDSCVALSSLETTWFVLLEVVIQVCIVFLVRKDCLNINDAKSVSTSFLPTSASKL